ncbi:MAG: thiamine pyrophosphate-binding protein, partial [Candidatus Nanopelagicales bacterium]
MTNPQSVQGAESLVNSFLSAGVRNFVVSPGSRNGALSLALASASNENLVNLAVRLDERSAAFVALGMALKTKTPAVVVCTSGTAAANLLPALVEAKYSEVPLIAITADRPKELINTGASQTIDQENIFGHVAQLNLTLDSQTQDFVSWANYVEDLINEIAKNPQPAHINIHFSEPLIPSESFKFLKPGNFKLIKNEQIELPDDFINKKGLIIAGATFENLDSYVD